MKQFLESWAEAALTSLGFFWMALWAFALGYLISSLIQVLVTRKRMQKSMGESGIKSVALGTFFGFISSSCSFAALSTTRALFQKGAGLVPALAFMLASTNLVIELGIVITIFLSWQFVVGEYLGGFILIGFAWIFVRLTKPNKLVESVRKKLGRAENDMDSGNSGWMKKATSLDGWQQIGMQYVMEWQMVWKDVLIGFTAAGIISAYVPDIFFETLFIGSGGMNAKDPGFLAVVAQVLIGPVAAFFTFIGSMGNIPLAALLFNHGVSFAGVMAFIFSDLVVLPILRINAEYYGWKLALYILALLLACLVTTSLLLHYGFLALDLLPDPGSANAIMDREFFKLNYGFALNVIFLGVSLLLGWLWSRQKSEQNHKYDHEHEESETSITDRILWVLSMLAIVWLTGGLIINAIGISG